MSLNWSMKPVPTIHSAELIDTPSVLQTTQIFRQLPRKRIFQEDQLDSFRIHEKINSLDDMNQSHSPPGFEFRQFESCVIFYKLKFDNVSQFPTILESIRIDKDLLVQLQYIGIPLLLPSWFINGHNAKLDTVLLDELKQRELYKPTGRSPFSSSMIRFALNLRHTSLQAYKLLLEKFPVPSISLLNKIQQGGVHSLKALKVLREKGGISTDLILMVDEMYLHKAAQYQAGEYVSADEEDI